MEQRTYGLGSSAQWEMPVVLKPVIDFFDILGYADENERNECEYETSRIASAFLCPIVNEKLTVFFSGHVCFGVHASSCQCGI